VHVRKRQWASDGGGEEPTWGELSSDQELGRVVVSGKDAGE
jgi:hypothetical protein